MLPREILNLIESGECHKAISAIEKYLVDDKAADDTAYYAMGRLYWQLGEHAEAVNCYRRALELNPNSPARHALEIANDVFDFFNPDLLNP